MDCILQILVEINKVPVWAELGPVQPQLVIFFLLLIIFAWKTPKKCAVGHFSVNFYDILYQITILLHAIWCSYVEVTWHIYGILFPVSPSYSIWLKSTRILQAMSYAARMVFGGIIIFGVIFSNVLNSPLLVPIYCPEFIFRPICSARPK